MKLEYNGNSLGCTEWLILLIIIGCIALGIILFPYKLKCATMPVSEMPGYCLYLLQNK